MPPFKDITGQRFGKLTVVSQSGTRNQGRVLLWLCMCDCGNETRVDGGSIRSGHTQSCGCMLGLGTGKHGHTASRRLTPTYRSWASMKSRCLNPNSRYFKHYGGRGIRVSERWMVFENFLADMGERPKGLTLDRYPDNNGNYEPGNARWATRGEQQNNMRTTRFVEHDGERKARGEWASLKGMKNNTLATRLRRGWTLEDALNRPLQVKR